jgi:hypothetical protein
VTQRARALAFFLRLQKAAAPRAFAKNPKYKIAKRPSKQHALREEEEKEEE